jgi:hypothetical protein
LSSLIHPVDRFPSGKAPLAEAFSWFLWLTLVLVVIPTGLVLLPGLVVLSLLIITLSAWMMQRLIGLFNLKNLTIGAFFYFLYFSVILVPGFFIFAEEVTPSRWRFLWGIESVLLTVPAGIAIANFTLHFHKRQIASFFQRPVEAESLGDRAFRLYGGFLAVALVFVMLNVKETPVIPLFYLLRNPGQFMTVAVLREDSFKLLNSHLTYVYAVLRGSIFPFLILVAYGRHRNQRQKLWGRLFCISLAVGVFYASLTVEKSPVAAIFGLLFLFYYLWEGGKMGRAASILAIVLFLCFPLMVILLAYHGSDSGTLGAAIRAIGIRLFYSPAQIVYAYFEVFPSVVPFQHGASITKLAALFGWHALNIPNAVGMYMNTGSDLDTITANSCFIGNLNADFGLPGVVVGGGLAGFFMQAVSAYFFRRNKTPVSLASLAICMWAFGLLVTSGLPTTLLSGGVLFALILARTFQEPSKILPGAGTYSSPLFAGGSFYRSLPSK